MRGELITLSAIDVGCTAITQKNSFAAALGSFVVDGQRESLAMLEDLDCVSCDQFDCPSQLAEQQPTPTRSTG
jgi:hypothetical protein